MRRNDGFYPVIPGKRSATRNPEAAPNNPLDSGVRRNDEAWNCALPLSLTFDIAICDIKLEITVCDLKSEGKQP
jgi:hypothetical protein